MPSATPRETKGDATRRALLTAAIDRFARDGFRATSVTDIARDAGVGGTTAYVHFDNKEALFLEAVDTDLASLFEEFAARAARGDALPDGLLPAALAVVEEHPLARRLLAGLEPEITGRVLQADAFDGLRVLVTELIEGAQAAGVVRPDLDAHRLAQGLAATVVAVSMAAVQIGDVILDEFGPGIATLLRGVLTPDPRLPAEPPHEV